MTSPPDPRLSPCSQAGRKEQGLDHDRDDAGRIESFAHIDEVQFAQREAIDRNEWSDQAELLVQKPAESLVQRGASLKPGARFQRGMSLEGV